MNATACSMFSNVCTLVLLLRPPALLFLGVIPSLFKCFVRLSNHVFPILIILKDSRSLIMKYNDALTHPCTKINVFLHTFLE